MIERNTDPSVIYAPEDERVVQDLTVSVDGRDVPPVAHLVQYDDTLPVVAVRLTKGGRPYTVPEEAAVNIRMRKPDGNVAYNPALGVSEDRQIAYIGITQQMTAAYGKAAAVIEIVKDGVLGTAPLEIYIDRNPVPEEAIESTDEFKTVQEMAEEAQKSAEAAESARKQSEAAKDAAQKAQTAAEGARDESVAAKEASETAQGKAEAAAKLAESWAVGGTGTREGEDADNSEYYAGQAAESAASAAVSEQKLGEAADTLTQVQDLAGNIEELLAGKADESDVTNLEQRVSDLESGNWFPELHLAGTQDAPKVDLTYEGGYLRIHVEAAE